MKKQYMKPAVEQVVIETEGMIAESLNGISLTSEGTSLNTGTYATGDAMSKNNAFDLWAEDEE